MRYRGQQDREICCRGKRGKAEIYTVEINDGGQWLKEEMLKKDREIPNRGEKERKEIHRD
jgi:hypothetical protein